MAKHTATPWVARKNLNNRWWNLYSETEQFRVASDLNKIDCDFILRTIVDREHIKNENVTLRKQLKDAESTVKRLRAYIRQNEQKTLRGMKLGTWSEPI